MNELLMECTLYLNSNPIRIDRELFDLGAKRCVRFKYRVLQVPSPKLGLLAGEVIHQLRSTLDNLVWALGQSYSSHDRSAKNEQLSFPVAESEDKYREMLARPTFKGILHFPETAQAAILGAQPFRRQLDGPNLDVLHSLWNADKHRVLTPFLAHSSGVRQELGLQEPAFLSVGEIADGVVFCEGALPPQGIADGAAPELTGIALCIRDPRVTANYAFLPLLYGCIKLVTSVINQVAPLLRPE